jgi:hypothetical protein
LVGVTGNRAGIGRAGLTGRTTTMRKYDIQLLQNVEGTLHHHENKCAWARYWVQERQKRGWTS